MHRHRQEDITGTLSDVRALALNPVSATAIGSRDLNLNLYLSPNLHLNPYLILFQDSEATSRLRYNDDRV